MAVERTIWNIFAGWPLRGAWWLIERASWLGWMAVKRLPLAKPKPIYGDAHWASPREIKREGYLGDSGLVIGKVGQKYLRLPQLHALMYAPTGSGKTTAFVVPNVLLNLGSTFLLNDPKGDVFKTIGPVLEREGYDIFRLDFANPDASDAYDPASYLRDSRSPSTDAEEIARACIPTPVGDTGQHFAGLAQKMLKALLLHGRKTGNSTLRQAVISLTDADKRQTAVETVGAVAEDGEADALQAFQLAGGPEQGSFGTTLANTLEFFKTPEFRGILEPGDGTRTFTWDGIFASPRPSAVFVHYPMHQDEQFAPIIRVLYGLALASASRWYIQTGYEPLARRFLVIADEAGSMGTCEALAKGITYLRAANCQILASFQSPGQVETLYRDPRSFQANFEAWIVPRAKDVELGRQLSDLMGDTTITSESHQSGGRDGKTSSQAARRLLAPGELRQLAWEEQIVLTDSLNIKCRKAFWFEDRNLRKEN